MKMKAVESKGVKVSLVHLIQIRDCFVRVNISNQSKSLHDKYTRLPVKYKVSICYALAPRLRK